MELLQNIEDRGYPSDYLLSRIHGRRALLFRDWDSILFSPDITGSLTSTKYGEFISIHAAEGIRLYYLKELNWIYYQMNERVRDIFKPYFTYSELNTLLAGLRYKLKRGRRGEIERLLLYSLLTEKIRDALKSEGDIPSVLEILQGRMTFLLHKPVDLQHIFSNEGLKKTEQAITAAVFAYILHQVTHPVMQRFFTSLINTKNLLTLYKYIKWNIPDAPALLDGGTISEPGLHKVIRSREIPEIIQLIYKQTGSYIEKPDVSRIEGFLNRYLTKEIKGMQRESSETGFILHYLWTCYIEARNLSIISYGSKIDKTMIKEELVS
jgi:vacuolar-type H+-ATPase subunit C/Vma6